MKPEFKVLSLALGASFIVLLVAALQILQPQSAPPTQYLNCTLMGCRSQLSVILSGDVPDNCSIELATITGDRRVKETCKHVKRDVDSADGCSKACATFYDFAPDEVVVTVYWDTQTWSQRVKPDYKVERPNGPICPPECRFGEVELVMP
jgi:hypothetical protein